MIIIGGGLELGIKSINAVSDTVLDMINAVYHDKNSISLRLTFREKLLSHHQAEKIELLNTFEFIKAVSDTVLYLINAAYYVKPLIFIRATF